MCTCRVNSACAIESTPDQGCPAASQTAGHGAGCPLAVSGDPRAEVAVRECDRDLRFVSRGTRADVAAKSSVPFCAATNSQVAEISTSVEHPGDFDPCFRWSKKDDVHPSRHASATGDSESRSRFTGERMTCEELASLPNGGKPLSGGTGIVTCDEINDVEQV